MYGLHTTFATQPMSIYYRRLCASTESENWYQLMLSSCESVIRWRFASAYRELFWLRKVHNVIEVIIWLGFDVLSFMGWNCNENEGYHKFSEMLFNYSHFWMCLYLQIYIKQHQHRPQQGFWTRFSFIVHVICDWMIWVAAMRKIDGNL